MNTCLTHAQSYPQDGYCVYCGPPMIHTITGGTVNVKSHVCQSVESSGKCYICGQQVEP